MTGVPLDKLKKALDCNKSVFIQACAGAGKTFALTKRYAAILDDFAKKIEQGADPGSFDQKQILVITFTKKATGEMTDRIYKDVNRLLSGTEIDEMKKQGINFCPILRKSRNEQVQSFTTRLKDTFSQNSISTIDSFCARILREFAYKLGLDPQFLSQDEHDTQRFLNETLDTWISERLAATPDHFDVLLEEYSFSQIKEIMKSMFGSREILDEYIRDFEQRSEDQIWRDWLRFYTPDVDIENLTVTFESLWKRIPSLCVNEKDALYIGVKKMYEDLCTLDRQDPLEYRAEYISGVVRNNIFFTKGGTYLKKNTGTKGNWTDNKDQVMGWFQLLKDTINEEDILLTPGPQDKKIIPVLKDLIKKYRDFDAYFSAIRMDRDLLDFSDIIMLTHRLLKDHPEVRKILGKRYRHIMLDEFQDTNPLRWQIIEMILNAGSDIKLFVVGDRKQSIYRFNNADVTVMNIAQDEVKKLGGESLDFNDNYRSSQKFINEAINPLMGVILKKKGEPKEPYEADFEETQSPILKAGLNSETIERIWCQYEKDNKEYTPAYHAAYQVKRLLEDPGVVKIDKDKDKPLIAVLLRRSSKLPEYLQAFHEFDIPVSILGGKDFYDSPAMRDIFYLISVLDNPLDDHALIGLLRSPFFALSDPIIHQLTGRGKTAVFEAMSIIPELQNTYHEILIWKEKSRTAPLDELIADILDSEDRELGYISELMPEQQLANLDKAVNIIRGLQRSGSSLREIREFLHYQIKTKTDESQAVYPAMARVQILTVHKAKGLEFPIVVIPEMNIKGNSDRNKFRYGRSADRPEISLSTNDEEKPGLLTRLKEITKKEEEAEEKRIFYVAVTRAVHKVLLLGEGEEGAKALKNSWWTKYARGLLENPADADLLPENWGSEVEVIEKRKVMSGIPERDIHTIHWNKKRLFNEPGKYLYRTPHDLMGDEAKVEYYETKSGLGTAPGTLFHYCMEQGWLDDKEYEQQIKEQIKHVHPDVDGKALFEKVSPWLANIRRNELATILLDPDIEKYPELKIKAWLGNGRDIVQVNGTIDLFYKMGERWVILDYKTDTDKRRLPGYRKQIQSYLWMVKQAFGIDASAMIYFVSIDEIVAVEWDENYFETLPLDMELRPVLPLPSMELSGLIPEIKDGRQLILCASGQHEEQLYCTMALKHMLRPDINISTLNKFLQETGETGISQDKLRLMIRHANPGMKNGTAELLAKAQRDEELQKGRVKTEFRPLYKAVTSSQDYRPANLSYSKADAKGQRVILLDVYAETELEKVLISRLEKETELIRISSGGVDKTGSYTLLEAFSPREEVLACARHILDHCRPDEQILITVASMEKYAPHLQRQLPKLGLRARFIGPRSLYELPCINLLMNYLKLCAKNDHEWTDLAPVLLHPMMKTEDQWLTYDKDTRLNPLDERMMPETRLKTNNRIPDLLNTVQTFAEDLKQDGDADTCKACEKFTEILEQVLNDLKIIGSDNDIQSVYREMAERIKKESIPRRDQWNGIPVVGFLDSLGVHPDKLYVLGMVEGDIPRQENENPFFIRNHDYSLELNRHFMEEWKKLGDAVIFSSSKHAEDGAEQNRSSFLEGLDLDVLEPKTETRREELLKYSDRLIDGAGSHLIDRHCEILNGKREIYSGNIRHKQTKFDLRVTSVDTLLACPMRFYFDTELKCAPMDQDEALFWGSKKGTVVHKSFEDFITAGGYDLEPEAAIELMQNCLNEALETEGIDKTDPRQMDHFRSYVRELYAGSENNCLALNLDKIRQSYPDYTRHESEKDFSGLRFGHAELDINLRGRIDKVMIDERNKKLIASDFKTGEIKPARLSKYLLSQLYLYLKYCAEAYPGYELKAMYELLKKPTPRDTKMLEYTLSETEFRQGKQSVTVEEFEEHLRQLFTQISAGKYYITEKEYQDACEYCPYAGLCRKDTRLKIKET